MTKKKKKELNYFETKALERRCSKCWIGNIGVEMEQKGFIETGNCESNCCPSGWTFYQCPNCKNIEMK